MEGKVKWFSNQKGMGYISVEGKKDHYFNVRHIKGEELPSSGDTVSFDTRKGKKGRCAANATIKERNTQKRHNDDRVSCPKCHKKIVPRLVIQSGQPQRSLCPYCAAVVQDFRKCFIATSVYGDIDCFEVNALRHFRDETLLQYKLGQKFVELYYKYSPPIADKLTTMPKTSNMIRACLNFFVNKTHCKQKH